MYVPTLKDIQDIIDKKKLWKMWVGVRVKVMTTIGDILAPLVKKGTQHPPAPNCIHSLVAMITPAF